MIDLVVLFLMRVIKKRGILKVGLEMGLKWGLSKGGDGEGR